MHVRAATVLPKFALCLLLLAACVIAGDKHQAKKNDQHNSAAAKTKSMACTCGVFLSGQFKKGSRANPSGDPLFTDEIDKYFSHDIVGQRACANECLGKMIKYLPQSANIICAAIDRDCFRERAYLFTQQRDDKWTNTNLSAGKPFCCKNNKPYTCPPAA